MPSIADEIQRELTQQVRTLQRENGILRARLSAQTRRAELAEESARRAWRLGGWR